MKMTKVILSENCGNSPKNIFAAEFTAAFARADIEFILGKSTEDITWDITGSKFVRGMPDFSRELETWMKQHPVEEMEIFYAITHGKAGAVNGRMKMENGKEFAFCFMYEFGSVKGENIKTIYSYIVELNQF